MNTHRSARGSLVTFVTSLLAAFVVAACSSASFDVAPADVASAEGQDVGADIADIEVPNTPDTLEARDSQIASDALDAPDGETSADVRSDSDAEDVRPDAEKDAVVATDAKPDTVTYPPLDACPGGGTVGEVVIGVCKPSSGDSGYLGVALRVLYPPGTIVPNEEWKNPWPGCSSSTTTADCICCHIRPTSGAAMPLKSDVDFRAGTSTKAGSPVSSWYTTTVFASGSYYGYWGSKQVGYAPNGTFPPLYKGKANALFRPTSGFDLNDVVFHYE